MPNGIMSGIIATVCAPCLPDKGWIYELEQNNNDVNVYIDVIDLSHA